MKGARVHPVPRRTIPYGGASYTMLYGVSVARAPMRTLCGMLVHVQQPITNIYVAERIPHRSHLPSKWRRGIIVTYGRAS